MSGSREKSGIMDTKHYKFQPTEVFCILAALNKELVKYEFLGYDSQAK